MNITRKSGRYIDVSGDAPTDLNKGSKPPVSPLMTKYRNDMVK